MSADTEQSVFRKMPPEVERGVISVQAGKRYLPAQYRIAWFRSEHLDWTIETFIVEGGQEAGFATVRAVIKDENDRIVATAHKTEDKKAFPAGYVEKAETGSVARALMLLGYGTHLGDMQEGRYADTPVGVDGEQTIAAVWEGPGQCPRCNAPEGKRHAKPCTNGSAVSARADAGKAAQNGSAPQIEASTAQPDGLAEERHFFALWKELEMPAEKGNEAHSAYSRYVLHAILSGKKMWPEDVPISSRKTLTPEMWTAATKGLRAYTTKLVKEGLRYMEERDFAFRPKEEVAA